MSGYTMIFNEVPAILFLILLLAQIFVSTRASAKLRKEFEEMEDRMDKMQRDIIDLERASGNPSLFDESITITMHDGTTTKTKLGKEE